jgi:hypothetical protein
MTQVKRACINACHHNTIKIILPLFLYGWKLSPTLGEVQALRVFLEHVSGGKIFGHALDNVTRSRILCNEGIYDS